MWGTGADRPNTHQQTPPAPPPSPWVVMAPEQSGLWDQAEDRGTFRDAAPPGATADREEADAEDEGGEAAGGLPMQEGEAGSAELGRGDLQVPWGSPGDVSPDAGGPSEDSSPSFRERTSQRGLEEERANSSPEEQGAQQPDHPEGVGEEQAREGQGGSSPFSEREGMAPVSGADGDGLSLEGRWAIMVGLLHPSPCLTPVSFLDGLSLQ